MTRLNLHVSSEEMWIQAISALRNLDSEYIDIVAVYMIDDVFGVRFINDSIEDYDDGNGHTETSSKDDYICIKIVNDTQYTEVKFPELNGRKPFVIIDKMNQFESCNKKTKLTEQRLADLTLSVEKLTASLHGIDNSLPIVIQDHKNQEYVIERVEPTPDKVIIQVYS